MPSLASLTPLLLFITSALALPADLEKRAGATCGSVVYSAAAVNAASQKACSYYKSGTQVGSNDYPHTFNNNEGFSFAVSGPYQEFPILSSGALYTGGKYSTIPVLLEVLSLNSQQDLLERTALLSIHLASKQAPSHTLVLVETTLSSADKQREFNHSNPNRRIKLPSRSTFHERGAMLPFGQAGRHRTCRLT